MRTRSSLRLQLALVVLLAGILPWWLPGRRAARRPRGYGRELETYRKQLAERTATIDEMLGKTADTIDRLRRRDVDVDVAVDSLQAAEEELDDASSTLEEMLAPEELHGLHMEYEANLERALRGIVTALRGCGITKLPHRPPEDEEPFTYWKRGYQNVTYAQMRMREVAEVLASWEPGKPAEVNVSTRLHRT